MILKSSLENNYATTAPFEDIAGLKITIPEDGYYKINGNINVYFGTTSVNTLTVKLAINGTIISSSGGSCRDADAAVQINNRTVPINNIVYLKVGDTITVKCHLLGGNATIMATTAAQYATYIEAINLTKLARGGL